MASSSLLVRIQERIEHVLYLDFIKKGYILSSNAIKLFLNLLNMLNSILQIQDSPSFL
jgi:hypothetical protein